MNLHGIVRGAIGAVNPDVTGFLCRSIGSTTAADGTRIPAFARPVALRMQAQELTTNELRVAEGMNIQGNTKKIYMPGEAKGVARLDRRGGDIIVLNGEVWLVVNVLEVWPDWCAVIVSQQLA